MPPLRYAALRGFRQGAQPAALLVDPYAAAEDFDTETELLLDDFLVAWNNTALCMRKRDPDGALPGCPARKGSGTEQADEAARQLHHRGQKAFAGIPDGQHQPDHRT